jgi:RNA polymerase sigma-70 factor (ECF subfamily)
MANEQLSYAELAHRICAGDSRAEGDLASRLTRGITQIIVRLTGNFAVAEELCQETLLIVLARLRTRELENPDKLPAFAAQIARNLVIAERRKERRRKTDTDNEVIDSIAAAEPGQEDDAQRESAAAAIGQVLREMRSARDRLLLVRYYLRDDDKRDICRDLNLSEPSFNVVLFRARSRFLELLEKHGFRGKDLLSWVLL